MAWISYAQAKEDIHLLRALSGIHHTEGFYIDVGAWEPDIDSVTKLFYDAGWHGINIEPSPIRFSHLVEQRPRDINLQVAISDKRDPIAFYDQENGGLGTTVAEIADFHTKHGLMRKDCLMVETMTLTEVCDCYAPADIHFLKIDVEGAEASVLRSLDFSRYRPWLLCIECHFPLHPDQQMFDQWHDYVEQNKYRFVYTDMINRYYVAEEHKERAVAFEVPGDFYIHVNDARRVQELEKRVRDLEEKLRTIASIVA